MKQKRHKSLQEYRLIILDMDGTLYYQFPLRICMCIELLLYYILHINRITELFMLRRFRKSYESGILEEGNSAVTYWMQEKPLRYITLFRDKKLLYLIRQLRERGARITVYSDYPAQRKIGALPDFTADYCFCAADTVIQCLKPETQGLKNIVRIIGEPVENSIFIGDRYEKDGKCAEGLGMDYIILDKNCGQRFKFYRREFSL
ncbi:hypothetical protein FACS189483_04640 [Spirochaetia bacterium]|nr:hypothetical protein FACS189483_04640 [Spirochaetia bacterium]